MSDIRFNQWLHQSGTGGVSQVASGAVGVGTTNPLADFYVRGDAQITGILTAGHIAMGSSITFGDDDRAYFGDGTDLQIYHSGSDSFIQDTGTGDLKIRSSNVRIEDTSGNLIINASPTSAYLYSSGNAKLGTAGWGVQVTGILKLADATDSSGATNHLALGASNDLKIFHDGSTNRIHGHTGYLDIYNSADLISITASNRIDISDDFIRLRSRDGSDVYMTGTVNSSVDLYYNGNKKFETTNTGAVITGITTATVALQVSGATSNANSNQATFDYNSTQTRILSHNSSGSSISFFTNAGGANVTQKVLIASDGQVTFGTTNPVTLKYLGTGHPYNNNNNTIHGFGNVGLVGQYSTLNMPMDHSTATTAGNWWMLGRAHGTTNEWGLSTRPGNSNNLRRVWRCVTRSQNDGILDYQSFHSFTGTETLRIDSSSRALINNRGNAMPGLSANADDLVIGYGTESNETGMTMYSTSTNNIRFADNSGTDGAIEYSHSNRWLNFSTANAYKMRITSQNGGSNPKVSVGALATSSFLNNSTDGDRSTVKVGNYLHLDSGGNGNFLAGMSYNCWPQGQQNFYQGTVTASNADNRAAAVLMRYGRTEFWNDNSTTGYTAAQQITTMQNNMTVHAAGYVTTPNQPAFKIAIMSQNSPNSGVVSENNGFTLKDGSSGDTFRDAFNNGDHFDQATGKFTAPVTGVYYFHFSVMRASTAGSGSMDLRIKKNTSLMLARSYRANYSTEGNFASINVTTITSMTAGHFIEFHLGTNMSTYEDDSYMLGYLIG